jgi:DNA-binding transcriptional MerR regulator
MRIAELSRRSGIPVPTIKYYLREGLLPPGELSSPNQARYSEAHLSRLQLVRALLEIGRLPIASIKDVLAEIDRPKPDVHTALGRALKAIGPGDEAVDAPEVDELLARHGWEGVHPSATARRGVAEVIAALRRLGAHQTLARLDDYAEAAQRVAEIDLAVVGEHDSPEGKVYSAVIGTILGDALLAALRRLAQESASARTHGLKVKK